MSAIAERGVAVPMRDGVALAADVYRPGGGRVPALLQRTPYGTDLPPLGRPANALRLVDAGYAVVIQDVRGRGRSGGRFAPFVQEAADGADTVAWLSAQDWWNGRLGMFGSSYSGYLQWALAERLPDGVHAIAPHVAGPDPRAWFGRDGAREWGFGLWWALAAHGTAEAARRGDGRAAAEVWGVLDRLEDAYRRGVGELPAVLDGLVPYARDWIEDPRRAPGAVAIDGLAVPTLLIAGWHDIFLEQTLAAYRAGVGGGVPTRLVIGPWSHTVWSGQFPQREYGRYASMEAEDVTRHHLQWFDRWLRGEGEQGEGVRFFLIGPDRWEESRSWPPAGVRECRWSLSAADGRLALGPSARPPEPFSLDLRHDPGNPVPTMAGQTLMAGTYAARRAGPWDLSGLLTRDDVVAFASEPLTAAVEIVGTVRFEATVTAPGGGDLACSLLDLGPCGKAMHVVDGIRRLDGGATSAAVSVTLGTSAYRVESGHQLVLTVARSNFPRFDLNPGRRVGLVGGPSTALILPTREVPA